MEIGTNELRVLNEKYELLVTLQLLNSEIEERDRKRRNAYISCAKFDIIKTFENYTFEDIKLPTSISVADILDCSFVPKKEDLILFGNVGAGKTHLAIATGISACNLGSKLLLQVISDFYERNSLIITTNLDFDHWNDIFDNPKITAALLDRIIHTPISSTSPTATPDVSSMLSSTRTFLRSTILPRPLRRPLHIP